MFSAMASSTGALWLPSSGVASFRRCCPATQRTRGPSPLPPVPCRLVPKPGGSLYLAWTVHRSGGSQAAAGVWAGGAAAQAPIEDTYRPNRSTALWCDNISQAWRCLLGVTGAVISWALSVAPAHARKAAAEIEATVESPSMWAQLLENFDPNLLAAVGAAAAVAVAVTVGFFLIKAVKSILPRPPEVLVSEGCSSVPEALGKVYFEKLKPLEDEFKFGIFHSASLNPGDFNAKPSILLLGQYSTGKTTFIKHLLGREYPGSSIGPEPTTDRFIIVSHGKADRRTPGNTVAITRSKPYQGLSTFGEGFLSRFEEAQCEHDLLKGISLIDTPGVLSGEKQRLDRAYNFIDVNAWFASRCDMILLLFDPFKLDISDEFRQVIEAMKDHHDKIRVVLNKSDQVSTEELMRVYGALMWSLAKVLRSPEVCRVYTGSFAADTPRKSVPEDHKSAELFEKEQHELLRDLQAVPGMSKNRKISEFAKRVRAAKTHLVVVHYLRRQLPWLRKQAAERNLMETIGLEFNRMKYEYNLRDYELSPGDFPRPEHFRDVCMSGHSLSSFPRMSDEEFRERLMLLDGILKKELPHISEMSEASSSWGG